MSNISELPNPLPTKLNIGCGFDIRKGWLNVDNGDWHKPDLLADITDLPMLPSEYFEEIVAQDVLEHIARGKQVSSLIEWRRLLATNGILRVRVPSLYDMAVLAKHPDWQSDEKQHWLVQMAYGTQAYPGDFHLCGYTPWTVVSNSREAGLIVSEASLMHGWLYELIFRRSDEIYRLTDEEFVHWCYFTLLHRLPEAAGYNHWLGQVRRGMSRSDVQAAMEVAAKRENS